MAQLFSQRSNRIFRTALVMAVPGLLGLAGIGYAYWWSPYTTRVGVVIDQPVPFSHRHHVKLLGIDCRHCHTSVEESASAGMPATEVCMSCHSQVWTDANVLAPARASLQAGTPLKWNRVYDLPEFTYFHHGIHYHKGIGCVTCHGAVDEMPLIHRTEALFMKWCLECHRAPEKFVRPMEERLLFEAKDRSTEEGLALSAHYGIETGQLSDCSICHR